MFEKDWGFGEECRICALSAHRQEEASALDRVTGSPIQRLALRKRRNPYPQSAVKRETEPRTALLEPYKAPVVAQGQPGVRGVEVEPESKR